MAKNDLQTLIRVRKWEVDEKQRGLAVLLRQEESVIERQAALESEIKREIEFTAEAPPEERFTFSAYLARCDDYRQQMNAMLQEIQRRISGAQEELGEAFRRLKPFEESQKKRDAEEEKEAGRLEQIELDEVGLNLHRRRAQRLL
jgi:flagellar FliJ protein